MKLLSTEIGENSIELTFADDPHADAATMLVSLRVPLEIEERRSVAYHRYHAIRTALEALQEHLEHNRRAVEQIG